MTGMEHAIEQAAEVIRVAIERQADIVADGLHLDVQGVITPHWIAEALATNGLLAPAPLREEWGVAESEEDLTADLTLGWTWTDPSDEWATRQQAHEMARPLLRRYVTGWEEA